MPKGQYDRSLSSEERAKLKADKKAAERQAKLAAGQPRRGPKPKSEATAKPAQPAKAAHKAVEAPVIAAKTRGPNAKKTITHNQDTFTVLRAHLHAVCEVRAAVGSNKEIDKALQTSLERIENYVDSIHPLPNKVVEVSTVSTPAQVARRQSIKPGIAQLPFNATQPNGTEDSVVSQLTGHHADE